MKTWKKFKVTLYREPVGNILRDLEKFRASSLSKARGRGANRYIYPQELGKIPSSSHYMRLKTSKTSEVLFCRESVSEAPIEDMRHDLYFLHVKSSLCASREGESVSIFEVPRPLYREKLGIFQKEPSDTAERYKSLQSSFLEIIISELTN